MYFNKRWSNIINNILHSNNILSITVQKVYFFHPRQLTKRTLLILILTHTNLI